MSTKRSFPKTLVLVLSLASWGAATSNAATATTDPVGYNTISLLANSDTYVSVPFHRPAAFVGQVASVAGNVITLAGTPGWTAGQFVYAAGTQPNTYYAFIRSGSKEGNYYTVTGNGTNTLTLDLAGDNISGVVANVSISVIPYWTLGTLFPASDAGVSFAVTTSGASPETEIHIPDMTTAGTNLSAARIYRYRNAAWRQQGQPLTDNKNDDILIPDSYFRVRNTSTGGVLTQTGAVSMHKIVTLLQTNTTGQQDNPVGLPRPVPVSLNDSGLISSGGFVASNPTGPRADELLVYDNTTAAVEKSASAIYFYRNGAWRKAGAPATDDFGSTIIFSPGTGVVIRKAATTTGNSVDWTNSPTY